MRVRNKVVLGIVLAAFILAPAALVAPYLLKELQKQETDIPTARAFRGPLELKVYTTGELRAARTAMLVAPPVGGVLQIVRVARTGSYVNPGDVVVEFDPSEQEYNLEQSGSQLEEAEQEVTKMRADQAVRVAQDNVALLRARFDVRRAELDVKGNDLLPAIDAKRNLINLEEAKRRLEQMERDVKSRASSDRADLAVLAVKRSQAMMGMQVAQRNIDNMTLLAPIGGVVVAGQNMEAMSSGTSMIIMSGMEIPEYRDGDQTFPGRTICQIHDVGQMEILSKVTETDRGSLDSGQAVDVRVDSLPLRNFTGKIKSLAGSASSSQLFDVSSTRSFDAAFELEPHGERLNPGVTARVVVRGTQVHEALSLPRQALFQKEGKPVVYVRTAQGWEARAVQIKYLTESRAVIDGLEEGAEVALVNPDLRKSKPAGKAGPLGPVLGGASQ